MQLSVINLHKLFLLLNYFHINLHKFSLHKITPKISLPGKKIIFFLQLSEANRKFQ